MRARFLWEWALALTLFAITGWLSRFLVWLEALPERQAQVVVGALLLVLPASAQCCGGSSSLLLEPSRGGLTLG